MAGLYESSILLPLILDAKCVLFFIVFLIVYHYYKIYTHLNQIPMPPCNLLLGHAPDFAEITQILQRTYDHNLKYGRILRILIGPVKPCLLVTDPKLIELLLTSSKVEKSKYMTKFLSFWLGQGLLLSSGSLWRSRRKALTPWFSQTSILKKYVDHFERNADKLTRILRNEVEKEKTNVYVLGKRFALDVICEAALNSSVNAMEEGDNAFQDSVNVLSQIFTKRILSLFKKCPLLYKHTEDYKNQLKAHKVVKSFVDEIVEKKEQNRVASKDIESFLDLLVQTQVNGEYLLQPHELRDEVHTFIFAGHETTAHSVAFTLNILSQHPEAQEKILEEQKQIFGKKYLNPTVTYEDLYRMTYLEQVLNECLRLYPPIPFIGRKLTEDMKYGDLILPKNLNILINIFGTHRDPINFLNPDAFIPERFEKKENILPYTFLPFSSGPRSCLGRRFAMLELKSCISKIVRNFEIVRPNPPVEMKLYPSMTLCSLNGVHVKFNKRCNLD